MPFPFPSGVLFHQEHGVVEDIDAGSLPAILRDPVSGRAVTLSSPPLQVWRACEHGARADDPRFAPPAFDDPDQLPRLLFTLAQMGLLYATDGGVLAAP